MILNAVFKQMPMDIVSDHIMPYIVKPQHKKLLKDIRSFHCHYNIIHEYYSLFLKENILLNDLLLFYNNHIHYEIPIFEFSDDFINIVRRNYKLATMNTEDIKTYFIHSFHKHNIRVNNRFLIALLKPKERIDFMNKYILGGT